MDTSLTPESINQAVQSSSPNDKALVMRNGNMQLRAPSMEPPTEEEEGLNLREIWRKIWQRKWLVLSIVTLATTITTVQMMRQKSIYQATATIEIGKDNQLLIKTGDVVIQDDNSDLQTAQFLLQSNPLLEDVVSSLKLDKNPRFKDITQERSLVEAFTGPKPKPTATEPVEEIAPTESKSDLKSTRTREERQALLPYVSLLKNNLSIKPIRDTRLISISFQHTDPELAATVATTIARNFIERSFHQKTQKYSNTSDFLDTATRKLETQMRQAEQELANYTRDHGIFSNSEKEDLPATKLAHLHTQVMQAESDRLIKESLYEEVKRGHVAQLPEAFANASTGELQKKLSDLNISLAQLSVKFDINHPRIVETKQQIAAIEKEIEGSRHTLEEKLKADYDRALRDEVALKNALNKAKSESLQQNQNAIQYSVLKQNAETARQLYTNFLQKTSQANVEEAQQQRNVSIAEPAEIPSTPIGPLRTRSILFALILSLGAAIGLVFLLDNIDNTIKSVEDVNRYTHLPALGVIPKIVQSQESWWSQDKASGYGLGSVAEAYRMLRTAVLLSSAGHPPKTILITSSRPSEGKTTTSVNVAFSLAQLDLRVLILDADMRRPRIHKVFRLDSQPGLSNYLSSDAKMDALLRPTDNPNVWVISAGVAPPNPAELISSDKMRVLLRQLGSLFDHIIIDSPPVMGVSDSLIMSRLVDGVILVVQGGRTAREAVRRARQELANVGSKIFGIVLNNTNVKHEGYDYYYNYRYRSNYELEEGEQARQKAQV